MFATAMSFLASPLKSATAKSLTLGPAASNMPGTVNSGVTGAATAKPPRSEATSAEEVSVMLNMRRARSEGSLKFAGVNTTENSGATASAWLDPG